MLRKRSPKFIAAISITAVAILGWLYLPTKSNQSVPNSVHAQSASDALRYARGLSGAFEKVAKIITPSVVNISSIVKARSQNQPFGFNDPFFDQFKDFFGDDFFRRRTPRHAPEGPVQQGLGTGVIIDNDGHILTNNHVIGKADEVNVRLHDGRELEAKIIGTDPKTDLAVIKIEANNITPAKLGDSDALKIGEWVIAAGNPFGLDNTITAGIVSAKGRSILGGNYYEDFIQTDAAINPGNSGGPLVNLDGEVVGINTAIFSRSGGYMGIGFAIPSQMVKSVMASLINDGRVIRGWLGVGIQDLTEDLAHSFNYPSTEGALLGDIQPESPAAKGGLKQGDIIIRFDDERIKDINGLRNTVANTTPGEKVEVQVIREGRKKTLKVKIGEQPGDVTKTPTQDESAQQLGMEVEKLTPDMSKRLGSSLTEGVIVRSVAPGSLAAKASIQPGDIILSVNGKRILSLRDFQKAVNSTSIKKGLRMVVETQGMQRFVWVKGE